MKAKLSLSLLMLIMFLSGCSSQFVYNNLNWLAYWYIDDYVDLSREQKRQIDPYLERWLVWHKQEELASYQQHLQTLLEDFQRSPLTAEQWLAHIEQGIGHFDSLRHQVAPDLIVLSNSLTTEQIDEFFTVLEEQNQEREEDYFETSHEEREIKRIERLEEQIEDFTGRLNQQQVQMIKSYYQQVAPTFEAWMLYKKELQRELHYWLTQPDGEQRTKTLMQLMIQPQTIMPDTLRDARKQNMLAFSAFLAELSKTFTVKQKKRIADELTDLIEMVQDFRT